MDAGMRKYGEAATFNFAVYAIDGIDLNGTWVPANADCEIMKNEGTSTAVTATALDEGTTYSIALTATEMECARGVIKVQDAATKVILDTAIFFTTYGHASAEHAFDLDTSTVIVSSLGTDTIDNTAISATAEILADMTKISGSATAANNLEESALGINPGTVQAGTLTTTGCTTNLTGFLDSDLVNRAIVFQSGATNGCGAVITGYNNTNGEVLFSAGIATIPVAGDTFVII